MSQSKRDTSIKMQARAQALVNDMANREYRNAIIHFDTNMTSRMPAIKLEEMWTALQADAGPFVKLMSDRPRTGGPTVILDCKFQKRTVQIYVTFDEAANVSGLRFALEPMAQPAQAVITEAASPPASPVTDEQAAESTKAPAAKHPLS